MNKQIRIEIRWTYPTDATPGMRGWNLICPISYDGDADASPILEAALAVPEATERTIGLDLGVSDQRPTVEKVVEALGEEASRRSGEVEEARLRKFENQIVEIFEGRGRVLECLEYARGNVDQDYEQKNKFVSCPLHHTQLSSYDLDEFTSPAEAEEWRGWAKGRDAAVTERRRLDRRSRVESVLVDLRRGVQRSGQILSDFHEATPEELVEIERLQTEIRQAAADKRAENKAQRASEIRVWASKHGSDRLCEQLRQGFTGWPLYLSERLEAEIPGAEIDESNGNDCREVVNPTEAALAVASDLAARLELMLDLINSGYTDGLDLVSIQEITFPIENDGDCYKESEPETNIYVCCFGGKWRPGSEAFRSYDIRLKVE